MFARLPDDEREEIEVVLLSMDDALFMNRDAFNKVLTKALKDEGVAIAGPVKKAILSALSERDEEADICADKYGNPEPDTDLRDHELVPLKEDWREYVAREVTPFFSDAWVDEQYIDPKDRGVGRVGYAINFNRYFFQFYRPESMEQIDKAIESMRADISDLLMEVTL